MLNIVKRVNKESIIKLLAAFGVWCCVVFAVLIMVKMRIKDDILYYNTVIENKDELQIVPNLTSSDLIEQYFVSPEDFEVITISCSNHDMYLAGETCFKVFDSNGNLVREISRNNSSIEFGKFVEIPFEGKANEKYLVVISASDTEVENAIGIYGYTSKSGDSKAVINNVDSEYTLGIGIHKYTRIFRYLLLISIGIMLIGLIVYLLGMSMPNLTPEKEFLFMAIPIGIALLCFLSVNFINDGDAHLAKVYHYSNVMLGVGKNDDDASYISMRKDDIDTLYSSECLNARNAQNMNHIVDSWKWFVQEAAMVDHVDFRYAGTTNAIEYLPSVIGMSIARVLHLGTYPMLYLSKIFAFVFYLIGCYWAIKITPVGKHCLAMLAALPIAVQQAVGITYDTVTYVVLFLFFALVFRLYFVDMKIKYLVGIAVLSILIGLCKGGIYSPSLFILLFIPKQKMKGIKWKYLFAFGVGLLTLSMVILNYGYVIKDYMGLLNRPAVEQVVSTDTEKNEIENELTGNEEVEAEKITETKEISVPKETFLVSYVFKEPKGFLRLVVNTLIEWTGYYIEGIIGRMAAWAVERVPIWGCWLFGILILFTKNGICEEQYKIDGKLRVGLFGTFVLVLMSFFALFLIETPVSNNYIWGIQGRYFIPLLPTLFLALRNNEVVQTEKSEKSLFLGYYVQLVFFVLGYFWIFMTQVYK